MRFAGHMQYAGFPPEKKKKGSVFISYFRRFAIMFFQNEFYIQNSFINKYNNFLYLTTSCLLNSKL